MVNWRSEVYADGRLCAGCSDAAPVAWIPGRDDKPLPILSCSRLSSPHFPSEGARCPFFSPWKKEGGRGMVDGSRPNNTTKETQS